MSGVAIVRYLLANNLSLTAKVPASRIKAGVIPQGTPLPAISITQISGVQYSGIAISSSGVLHIDRVQVTVMGLDYPQQKEILALIRAALPNTRGSVNSISCDSIIHDSDGPDIFDAEIQAYFQSSDFMIRYTK